MDSLGRRVTREKAAGIGNLLACSEAAHLPDGEPSLSWDLVARLSGEEDESSPFSFK